MRYFEAVFPSFFWRAVVVGISLVRKRDQGGRANVSSPLAHDSHPQEYQSKGQVRPCYPSSQSTRTIPPLSLWIHCNSIGQTCFQYRTMEERAFKPLGCDNQDAQARIATIAIDVGPMGQGINL